MPEQQYKQLLDRPVRAADTGQVGTVAAVYLDSTSGEPALVAVQINGRKVGVPAEQAALREEPITLPYAADVIRTAPELVADDDVTSEAVEEIHAHFAGELTEVREVVEVGEVPEVPGHGGDTDTLTRSEEELRVGTTQVERERVRVRKYVVHETVTRTIPVTREEVRIEREAVTAAEAAGAGDAHIGVEDQVIVLHEEIPVIQKVTVPKERVHIGTETVTEQHKVTETLQKEQIAGPEGVEPA